MEKGAMRRAHTEAGQRSKAAQTDTVRATEWKGGEG
jgi:hypothetical protein